MRQLIEHLREDVGAWLLDTRRRSSSHNAAKRGIGNPHRSPGLVLSLKWNDQFATVERGFIAFARNRGPP
jgi:hypothetical protein